MFDFASPDDGGPPATTAPATAKHCHVVIGASAGTGKTHRLSGRYLSLMYEGNPVDRILATTFTRKAAGEILDRIVQRLTRAATDPVQCEQLARDIEANSLTTEDCHQLLRRLTTELHRVRIGTIDSFFHELARSFALELELPIGWQLIEEAEETHFQLLGIELLQRRLGKAGTVNLVHLLAKGETTRGVSQLLADTVSKHFDLFREAQPYGDRAWFWLKPIPGLSSREVLAALERLESVELPKHKKIIDAHQKAIVLASVEDWDGFVANGLVRSIHNAQPYYGHPIPNATADAYWPLVQHGKSRFQQRVADHMRGAHRVLEDFDECYAEVKEHGGLASFDDVSYALGNLSRAGNDVVAFRLDGWIDHLLLDEFQDTSPAQWQVIKKLAERITASADGSRTFFAVGDRKQAIYAFRSGTSRILVGLDAELKGLRREQMTTSYRSSPVITQTVNDAFLQMPQQSQLGQYDAAVAEWCAEFPKHITVRDYPGYACLRTGPAGDDAYVGYLAQLVARLQRQTSHLSVGVLAATKQWVS